MTPRIALLAAAGLLLIGLAGVAYLDKLRCMDAHGVACKLQWGPVE